MVVPKRRRFLIRQKQLRRKKTEPIRRLASRASNLEFNTFYLDVRLKKIIEMGGANPQEAKQVAFRMNPLKQWFKLLREFDVVTLGYVNSKKSDLAGLMKNKDKIAFLLHETRKSLLGNITENMQQLADLGIIEKDWKERRLQFSQAKF